MEVAWTPVTGPGQPARLGAAEMVTDTSRFLLTRSAVPAESAQKVRAGVLAPGNRSEEADFDPSACSGDCAAFGEFQVLQAVAVSAGANVVLWARRTSR